MTISNFLTVPVIETGVSDSRGKKHPAIFPRRAAAPVLPSWPGPHHHGDHVNGNQFFTQAEILSHPYCRAEVLKAVPNTPKMWMPTPGIVDVAEERRLVPPTVTFTDDLVYSYITKWIDVCNAILGWDVDVLVPGHGPIGGKKELAEMREYFQVLGVEARKRYDAKMSAGAASADIRLGRFDNWIGPERLIMDTVRWYAEWSGTLTPDYNANAVREATIEYNEVKAKQKKVSEMIPLDRMDVLAAEG